jgi:hypothetical protein
MLWWWFTQPNFIGADEDPIVGDFDGDGAEDLMIYKPSNGAIRFFSIEGTAVFKQNTQFTLGNMAGRDLKNKQILVGEFGQAVGRKDVVVVDKSTGQFTRFDAATEANGTKTFWWAFTTNASLFSPNDQICVANLDGSDRDGIIIRNGNTGNYTLFKMEFAGGGLQAVPNTIVGQLPLKPRKGNIVAAKVRNMAFRTERGGAKRDDIVYFDESTGELVSVDARYDGKTFTYWWSFNSNSLFEPNIVPQSQPWAVILCRFKGLPGDPAQEKLFRQMFTPGAGALVEYWHDASLGNVDISKSRVFGWVELDITRAEAAGKGRAELVKKGIEAARRAGLDPTSGFFGQIAVLTHNFSIDNPVDACNRPCIDWTSNCSKPDKPDNKCPSVWIDGSAAGRVISAPPHAHSGSFIAHEMGHGWDFSHDLGTDMKSPYGDLNCIMSAMNVNSFSLPGLNVPFGPSISFPQLVIHNWMYQRRIQKIANNWFNTGASFLLAPIKDRTANANLGVILPKDATGGWSYYLEYMKPIGWDKAIGNPKLVIRCIVANQSIYLGEIRVPTAAGLKEEWVEPQGNIRFQVERNQSDDRIIKVSAQVGRKKIYRIGF